MKGSLLGSEATIALEEGKKYSRGKKRSFSVNVNIFLPYRHLRFIYDKVIHGSENVLEKKVSGWLTLMIKGRRSLEHLVI